MTNPARLMDRMYRHQRHVYDATRKFYLLGRDQMLADLQPPPNGTILEIGCGTARNLIWLAQRHPGVRGFGIDVSREMLTTAAGAVNRAGRQDRIVLAQDDAGSFDPRKHFGLEQFDRVYFSYTLSMIPEWQNAVRSAARFVAPDGSLHIVDFGHQERLPHLARGVLRGWLRLFNVTPRDDLGTTLRDVAAEYRMRARIVSRLRGYSVHAVAVAPPVIKPILARQGRF